MSQHANREALDAALRSNESSHSIARRFGIRPGSVMKMRKEHQHLHRGASGYVRSTGSNKQR